MQTIQARPPKRPSTARYRHGMSRGRRARRSTEEVRRLILDAAAPVFRHKGFALATMDDIAAEAGVAVSVIYRQYGNKSELFQEAVLQPFVDFVEAFTIAWQKQRDEPWTEQELMREFIADLFDNLRDHRDALIGLIAANGTLDARTQKEMDRLLRRMYSDLKDMGQAEASRRGWFPAEDMEVTVRLVVAMVTAVAAFDRFFLTGRRLGRERLIDHMTALALYGLRLEPWPGLPALAGAPLPPPTSP